MRQERPRIDAPTAVEAAHDRLRCEAIAAHVEQGEGHVVILSVGTQRIGFVVDQLVGQEEVVIKPLGKMLQGTPGMSGATITGDGRIALILDVPSMLKRYAARRI